MIVEDYLDPKPYLGCSFEKHVDDMKKTRLATDEEENLSKRCTKFILALIEQIRQRLPDNIDIPRKVSQLAVEKVLYVLKPSLVPLLERMGIPSTKIDAIESQWRSITTVAWKDTSTTQKFWGEVYNYRDSYDHPQHQLLHGHTGRVTCLLYPNHVHSRYEIAHLVSGGVDFSVCLWDLYAGTLLHRFCVHAGEVTQLLVPPSNCSTRVLQSICSVASDHSVALVSLKERKCIMLASRHLFPVGVVKWRPFDDFMVVGCSDGSVYVWQMETGHLDRVLQGLAAEEVLSACDEHTGHPGERMTNPAVHLFRGLRHRNMAAIRHAAQRGLHHLQQQHHASHHPTPGHQHGMGHEVGDSAHARSRAHPLMIQGLRTNPVDQDSHVLFFDIEALIGRSFVDAASYIQEEAFSSVVVDCDCRVISCATIRTSSSSIAEQVAIALALTDGVHDTIYSDSKAAIKAFQMCMVAPQVLQIIQKVKDLKNHSLVWFPAHLGTIEGASLNPNDEAHSAARGLTDRVPGSLKSLKGKKSRAASFAQMATAISSQDAYKLLAEFKVQLLSEEYSGMSPGTLESQGLINQSEYQKYLTLSSSPETHKKLSGFIAKVKDTAETAASKIQAKAESVGIKTSQTDASVGGKPGDPKNAAGLAAKQKHLSLAETNLTMEIAQLLLSLLHAWGLDNDLDKARLAV
ncbi:hypothetical protein HPB51_016484 [Rhipicephalus microplus]|uniref:Wd40 domain protein n=1 Tax=Rhipicephalus microplus TaxID=6941 RepID=A0A9J6DP05_RHIMP|nr:hypothetical protein HPB51_016484 [Rhipicephalus microplus]